MNRYETVVLLDPTLNKTEYDTICGDYYNTVAEFTRKRFKTEIEKIGIKKLVYEIKKHSEANYVILRYYSDNTDDINTLERLFRIDENVLKFITVKMDTEGDPEKYDPADDPASTSEQNVKMQQPDAEDVLLGLAEYC